MAKITKGVSVNMYDLVFDDILDIQKLGGSYESIQTIVAGVTHIAPLGWLEKIEDGEIVSLHFFDNIDNLISMNFDASVLDIKVGQYVIIYKDDDEDSFNLYVFDDDEEAHAFAVAWMVDRICKIAPEMLDREEQ